MTSKTKYSLKTKDRDTYLDLVTAFPLVSICSADHLEVAGQVTDRILAKGKLDHGEELYLDALSDLVEAYEYNHETIEPASDADMLRHLMEAKGVSQVEVCSATGLPKSSLSEVLSGRKRFSRQMIRALAEFFQVDMAVLVANL